MPKNATNAAANASVNADADAQTDGYLGLSWDQIKAGSPEEFHPLLTSETGVAQLLTAGGKPLTYLDAIKKSPNAGSDLLELFSDPGFRAKASSIVGGKANGGGRQASYPTPVSPAPGIQQFASGAMLNPSEGKMALAESIRAEQDPNGKMIYEIKFRDGTTATTADPQVAAAAQEQATSSSETSAEGDSSKKPVAKKSRFDLPFDEQLAVRKEMYGKAKRNPSIAMPAQEYVARGVVHGARAVGRNLPTIGSAVLGLGTAAGVGAGVYNYFKGDDKPSDGGGVLTDQQRQEAMQMLFGSPRQDAPAPQRTAPSPQATPQPQQSPNPAGSPQPSDTTLMQLQRLMQSREYA